MVPGLDLAALGRRLAYGLHPGPTRAATTSFAVGGHDQGVVAADLPDERQEDEVAHVVAPDSKVCWKSDAEYSVTEASSRATTAADRVKLEPGRRAWGERSHQDHLRVTMPTIPRPDRTPSFPVYDDAHFCATSPASHRKSPFDNVTLRMVSPEIRWLWFSGAAWECYAVAGISSRREMEAGGGVAITLPLHDLWGEVL